MATMTAGAKVETAGNPVHARRTAHRSARWVGLPALALALAGAALLIAPAGAAHADAGKPPRTTPVVPTGAQLNNRLPNGTGNLPHLTVPTLVATTTGGSTGSNKPIVPTLTILTPTPIVIGRNVTPTTPAATATTNPTTPVVSATPVASPPAAAATPTASTGNAPVATATKTATPVATSPASSSGGTGSTGATTSPISSGSSAATDPATGVDGSGTSGTGTGTGTGSTAATGTADPSAGAAFGSGAGAGTPPSGTNALDAHRICRDDGTSIADLCEKDGPGSDAGVPGSMVNVIPDGFNPPTAATTTDATATTAATDATTAAAPTADAATNQPADSTLSVTLDRGLGADYAAGDPLGISYTVPQSMSIEVALVLADRRVTLYQGTAAGAGSLTTLVPAGAGIAVVELKATAPDGSPLQETAWFRVR